MVKIPFRSFKRKGDIKKVSAGFRNDPGPGRGEVKVVRVPSHSQGRTSHGRWARFPKKRGVR